MIRWRDAKWWIAIIATVVLGLVSIFLAVPPRKRLVIAQVYKTPLFLQRFPGTVITVNGKPVNGAYAETFAIYNAGSVPITPSDFDGPLTLAFGGGEIVMPSVGSTTPNGLPVVITSNGGALELKPLLLNPSDTICLSVLTTQARQPVVKGRIAGVTAIEFHDSFASGREVFHDFYALDWPVGLSLTVLASILSAAGLRVVRASGLASPLRPLQLVLASFACWTGGLLLLDYGAKSLDLYARFPSILVRVAFFASVWSCAVWLFTWSQRVTKLANPDHS
jgi:hypothetical protein